MKLLLTDQQLKDRQSAVRGSSLQALAKSLYGDLSVFEGATPFVPEQKALLSREGGRCPRDGAMLDFDPHSPKSHRCPACGNRYEGELHDRFWIYWYQLWLAERAVHAAALGAILGAPKATKLAVDILEEYCVRYPRYPNVDNALGPTRPFFSTYLESIWLLQLCVAVDIAEAQGYSPVFGRFREVVVEPSARLIQSFDEGLSNRQVWNNAALLAAYRLLGRETKAESVVWSESGVVTHLTSAMLADGTWYEGENYHFFAHRGLWYCMQLASSMDAGIPAELAQRFDDGFRAPFLTALPDLTFPSRRDSQYAVSLRQWRFAESCELGLARFDDRVLRGMLARLYAVDMPRGDTARWKSTAEAERNVPATRLDRTDLGWKSLLFARPELDLGDPAPLPSVLLEEQGVGVIRRDAGKVYVALDYGISGGGHGHPDRLNLLLMNGRSRILDDMGTGSYVDPSLHWYRSSLAHNAPFLDGRSQPRVDGALVAYEDRGAAGWICAAVPLARDVIATRAVVVMPDYLVDQLSWNGPVAKWLDLPLHAALSPKVEIAPAGATLDGGDGLEDGFRFARDARLVARLEPGETLPLTSPEADAWVAADSAIEVWRAVGPGAPGTPEAPFVILRARGGEGVIRCVWSWKRSVRDASLFPAIAVTTGAERHEHSAVAHGWNVAIHVNGARSTIDLEGLDARSEVDGAAGLASFGSMEDSFPPRRLRPGEFLRGTLGKDQYRRSEESWAEAGSPSADVEILNDAGAARITVDVRADRSFVAPGERNRLDNEHADVNGAGLQLYLESGAMLSGCVIVPVEGSSSVHVRPIDGWGGAIPVTGTWRPAPDGYHVELLVRPPAPRLALNLLINEKPAGRERRRGQLALYGSSGGWIYLRGDRLDLPLMPLLLDNE